VCGIRVAYHHSRAGVAARYARCRSNEKFGSTFCRPSAFSLLYEAKGIRGTVYLSLPRLSRSTRFRVRPRLLPGQRAPGDAFGVLDERLGAQQAACTGMASNVVGGTCGSESV